MESPLRGRETESATSTGNRLSERTSARPTSPARRPAGVGVATGSLPGTGPLLPLARDYLALTKPRIIGLLLVTTVATMFVADPSGPGLATILWTVLGGYLAAGGAGAINHYLERDRDARMDRTCAAPLVSGRIDPRNGLVVRGLASWRRRRSNSA